MKKYDFLEANEEIIHAVEFTMGELVATNRRIVVRKSQGLQTTKFDSFDYNYVAHIHLDVKNYYLYAIVIILVGLVLAFLNPIITVLAMVIGLVLFLYKNQVMVINLSGVPKPYEYSFSTSDAHLIEKFVSTVIDIKSHKT